VKFSAGGTDKHGGRMADASVLITKADVEGFYDGRAGAFSIRVDRTGKREPRSIDLVLMGLGSCTISTVAHYLTRKGLPTDDLAVELSAEYDEKGGHYKDFNIRVRLSEEIPREMHKIVAAIAKTCRIHRTLASAPRMDIEIHGPAAHASA
jgi:uncharacterized OsmC-like protein